MVVSLGSFVGTHAVLTMVSEVKATIDPDALRVNFNVLLRINRPLAWLWDREAGLVDDNHLA